MITLLKRRLEERKLKNLYRERQLRKDNASLINFSSNDYLGLTQHPEIIKALQKGANQYGVGSGASQIVCGYTQAHQDCEIAFAKFLGRERALLFANGYVANLGVLDAVSKRGDYIYQDRHNHASLLDAGRLSYAHSKRYHHKDINNITTYLQRPHSSEKFIISDGIFSIFGDMAPVDKLANISKVYQATLIIDDAHAIGVIGPHGKGSCDYFSLTEKDVPILVCPLGKAFGSYGAIVAGSETLIENLLQFSRPYIYSTALPPAIAYANLKSLDILQKETWRREKLQHLIAFFKIAAKTRNISVLDSISAIQSILVDNPIEALKLSDKLKKKGFWLYAMRPPSTPMKKSLLRITLNAQHTEQQIVSLLDLLL